MRLKFFLLSIIATLYVYPVINISFDNRGLSRNSIQITQSLINCFGDSIINQWVNENRNYRFLIDTDSDGVVQSIFKIIHRQNTIAMTEEQKKHLEKYLTENNITFTTCTESMGYTTDSIIETSLKNEMITDRIIHNWGSIVFPSNLLKHYNRDKLPNESAFQYLQRVIKSDKYILPDNLTTSTYNSSILLKTLLFVMGEHRVRTMLRTYKKVRFMVYLNEQGETIRINSEYTDILPPKIKYYLYHYISTNRIRFDIRYASKINDGYLLGISIPD